MTYNYIDVVDTAIVCGLEIKPLSMERTEVAAKCPFCGDKKYRLYLSRDRGNPTFYCQNCGEAGNAVTLYARYFNVYTKTAYISLMENPNVAKTNNADYYAENREIKPLRERHKIYLELLNMLTLYPKHRDNLRERGLPDKMIDGNKYRSMPETNSERESVAEKLADRFDLTGMPGFYTKYCRWNLYGKPGFLIPVCTKDNLIQGLQIRLDDVSDKKFRWLSTNGFDNGTKINGYVHVTGDTKSDILYITEGPLKGDVASYLAGGALFVCLTGVNATQYLADVLKSLKPKRIIECLDMDKTHNIQVRKALSKLQSIAVPLCEQYKPFYWSEDFKGIDDFLLFRKKNQEITI